MRIFLLHIAVVLGFIGVASPVFAQRPEGGRGPGMSATGRIYGKILESDKGDAVEYAVIQVFKTAANPQDSTKRKLVTGGLTASNGDFSIDAIPVGEDLVLVISFVGFETNETKFKLNPGGFGGVEKDLGNIKLSLSTLKTVVIEDESPSFKMEFDKRVYDVDKNPMNSGGTAQDVLRNIPSLQVDMDGNVSLRNTAPQIFVDGRPTTLTIDQIPADAIQKVEIITNPSAKYDASGGGGGIVNIIMKHNRSMGYNGSVRGGIDKRMKVNGGVDFNLRQGKFNFFANGNYNQRKSIAYGYTDRTSTIPGNETVLHQSQQTISNNFFENGKVGLDYFMDNRNTFTISESMTKGIMRPGDMIESRTDTLTTVPYPFSTYYRKTATTREFQNVGTSVLYKHLFAKEGTELTGDFNYNAIQSKFDGLYDNHYSDGYSKIQTQKGGVHQKLYTSQVDYVSKINEKTKIEFGGRAAFREYDSGYDNFIKDNTTGEFNKVKALAVNYAYTDQVYAAYGTFSKDWVKWKLQVGLRAESSKYKGQLKDTAVAFGNAYPSVLLPSLYLTRVINEKHDIQFAVSRKISRPSFMTLSPFTDLSDSLNISRGNPNLRPEFAHNAELSYQYIPNKKNTFIASAFMRYTTNITVRYQLVEYSPVLHHDIIVNTYANANSSSAMGIELVSKNTISKWLDITTNLNLYNSSIDGTNISAKLTNNINSYWIKTNVIAKLPKNFTLQLMGDYSSKKALEVGSSERGGGGGGGMGGMGMGGGGFGGSNNSVQGYVRPTAGLDISLKKDFFKNKNASLTLSFQDVFRSRINYSHSQSDYFVQDTFRRRDPQFWRLQFSWKFGKIDSSLFRRKNMKSGDGGGMEG